MVKRAIPPPHAPWLPAAWTPEQAYAIKALATGTAEPHQQVDAMAWIIHTVAATYDLPYRPDSARDSDFAAGKMYVGQQIVKLINLRPELIGKARDGAPPPGVGVDDEIMDR